MVIEVIMGNIGKNPSGKLYSGLSGADEQHVN
jgi:hypothetical protein